MQITSNNVLDVIKKRRSIRTYKKETIPQQILKEIVDCGRLAPTARNIQPWKFVIITQDKTIKKIAEATDHGKFLAEAPACILVFCQDTKYYLEDGCAATQNILIAAQSFGIGSCWIAGDKKPYAEKIRQIINAPEGLKLVSIIALGYPAENPSPQKKPIEEVLIWEHW
ncbi:MAG: nitroreductase family protein [Candidatus Omnitrophica bacterium]|nr:nitroreductase family protein [Candidatus Omnitrophota bacterium]MCM8817581.1 nitroreductase family protein [Candidatus Omnitrophota bacterium]